MSDVVRCDTCELPILRTCSVCGGNGVMPGRTLAVCKCAGSGLETIAVSDR